MRSRPQPAPKRRAEHVGGLRSDPNERECRHADPVHINQATDDRRRRRALELPPRFSPRRTSHLSGPEPATLRTLV